MAQQCFKPYDLLCTGTALLDCIIRGFDPEPVNATGYRAQSTSLNVGGEAVNASAGAAALGLKTAILAFADTFPAGDMIAATLRAANVSTEHLIRTAEHQTPVSTLFVREDGSRRTITTGAHSFNFRPDLYPEALRSARAVSLGSLFRAPYNDPDVLRRTVEALDNDTLLFADTKLPNFRKLSLDDIKDSLSRVDYIFPNEDEARYYSGQNDPDAMADAFLAHGVRHVIVKLGGSGCLFKSATERIRLCAHSVKVVDTTGAGDNFLAGFILSLLEGRDHETALRFANACGAVASTAVGACGVLKSRAQAEELLLTQPAECVKGTGSLTHYAL